VTDIPEDKTFEEDIFDFVMNDRAEIMLVISSYDGAPDQPVLQIDGGDTAIFMRDPHTKIRLPYMNPVVYPALTKAQGIYVTEMDGDDIATSYTAKVQSIRKIEA
jgi:hypothetical protein